MKTKRHKKLLVKLSLATCVAALPSKVLAQSLNCVSPLVFGQIITCGSAGSVTINADGTSASSCVSVSGPVSAARCIVTQGFPFRPIQFSINGTNFNISNGTANMNVNSFNILTNAGGCCTTTQTVPALNVPIGATITVGATQAAGIYTGSFGVTAVLQ